MIYAIDGATRRPGKPECLAVGMVYMETNKGNSTAKVYETESTSQRGELLALQFALRRAVAYSEEVGDDDQLYIITDSEYIYNAITKDWIGNWDNKDWVNAEGAPIKNQDIWKEIMYWLAMLEIKDIELNIYHIKGHVTSLGKVTAAKLIAQDPSGNLLREALEEKYEKDKLKKPEVFEYARKLFIENHGHDLPDEMFKKFIILNTIVDYMAGTYADKLVSEGIFNK